MSPAEQAEIERAVGGDRAVEAPAAAVPPPPAAEPAAGGGTQPNSVMNPDLSFILDVAGAAFSERENHQLGGHDPTRRGFNLQELEMSVSKSVDPYFRFDGHAVFTPEGRFELEEAYATTLGLPAGLQARAGLFLTRVGRINPTHPHAWDFVDQPLVLGRLWGGDGNRGLGAELSWLAPLPWYLELVASAVDIGTPDTGRIFYAGQDNLTATFPWDIEPALMCKQFFPLSDDWSLLWGLSYVRGPGPRQADWRQEVAGSDVYLKYRPVGFASFTVVSLQAEWYAYRLYDQGGTTPFQDAGYAELFWRFAQRWALASRYEHVSDGGVPPQGGQRQRVAANVTFWPTEFSRLRLQGSRDDAGDRAIWAGFLALEVVVGAHGAHAF